MRTSTHRTVSQTLTDDDGREFPLPIEDTSGDPAWSAKISDLPDGRVLVSYLVVDDDARHADPFDCDPWISNPELVKFFDRGESRDAWIEDHIACDYCKCMPDSHPVPEGYGEACDEYVCPDPDLKRWIDGGRFFWIERYEHGQVAYAIQNTGNFPDRQWDVAPGVGYIIIDHDFTGEPAEVAQAMLDEYTSWCNGDVYGIVHATYRYEGNDPERADEGWVIDSDDDVESCWGYVGHDYAEQALIEEHDYRKEHP